MNRHFFRRGTCLLFLLGAALLLPDTTVQGRYMRPDLEKVPVEQLVKNLKAQAAKNPKDATVLLNLARVHAMAYALKTDTAEVNKQRPNTGAWFGYEPTHVPFTAKKTDDPAKLRAARAHLEKAIDRYQQTLKLSPDNLTAMLGLAWCVEQDGKDRDATIEFYRRTIAAAWKKEQNLKQADLGWHSVTAEAAGYLI